MNFLTLFLMLLAVSAWASADGEVQEYPAQETADWHVDEDSIDMDQFLLENQDRSLIDWEELNPESWLDYALWKENRAQRDKFPDWKIRLRNTLEKEKMAVLIQCSGSCRVYRGRGSSNVQYMSQIVEGDEIHNEKDAYAWLLMADGSLMRISPFSSISFLEMNVSKKETHFVIRVNAGHMRWITRRAGEFADVDKFETDQVLLPLQLREANRASFARDIFRQMDDREQMQFSIKKNPGSAEQIVKLNSLIQEEKENFLKRDTTLLLTSPSTTIQAKNAHIDLYYDVNGEANFRMLKEVDDFKAEDARLSEGTIFFRGHNNYKQQIMVVNEWYTMDHSGKKIASSTYTKDFQKFGTLDLLLSHIPSIYLAREVMLRKYFPYNFVSNELWTHEYLGGYFGLFLWDQEGRNETLENRLRFLHEYTRRLETGHLFGVKKIFKDKETIDFDGRYIERAVNAYLLGLKQRNRAKDLLIYEMNDIQFYMWTLKKGSKHVSTYIR